ncbi:YdcH family protein [Paraferrimonas sp. SM1919]|uniref:YdcH family protein n=1 Tax=Paraferrimonas sp. SM1919 TaxID=2662263 RepID=UPI0013D77CF9|nr:YdcH family protein [Paraferrimonas sp. SM1919]
MLGEDHSLLHDFPEHTDKINQLTASDEDFKRKSLRYHTLDAQIRQQELDGSPISDDAMHELKNERAALKDQLYQMLIAST